MEVGFEFNAEVEGHNSSEKGDDGKKTMGHPILKG